MTQPIPPNTTTEDVALTRQARAALAYSRHAVLVSERAPHAWADPGYPTDPLDSAVHTEAWPILRAHGPAPFIGDPARETAHYVWSVAVHPVNSARQVAGPCPGMVILNTDMGGVDVTDHRAWSLVTRGWA